MQNPASASTALRVDTSLVIKTVASVKEAQMLPAGAVVGDLHGGLTFSDAVAAALESRSIGGWQEVRNEQGELWTLIVVNR